MPKKPVKSRRPNKLSAANTKKIILALLTLRSWNETVTVRKVTKLSGVSRFSFYMRYRNLKHALARWENDTINDCIKFIDACSGANVANAHPGRGGFPRDLPDPPLELLLLKKQKNPNHQAISAWFIFLSRGKKEFTLVAASYENQRIMYRMVEKLYDRLEVRWAVRGSRNEFGKHEGPAEDGTSSNDLMKKLWFSHAVMITTHWCQETRCDYDKSAPYISALIELAENPSRHCRY